MALNLANTVVKFLQQNPEQKFIAREIANWIFETYPDECRQKQGACIMKSIAYTINLLTFVVCNHQYSTNQHGVF